MSVADRVRELAAAYEEGTLAPEEMAELAALLESDAAARRVLVEEFMLTSGCAQHAAVRAADAPARGRWRSGAGATRWKRALYAGLAAAATVVIGSYLAYRGGPVRPPVARIASVVAPGGGARSVGDELVAGDRIRTGGGSVVVSFADDATNVSFGPDTTATVDANEAGKGVRLETGRLVARVAPQPVGRPMVFHTPIADCVVLGTVLAIEADAATTRLTVTRGRVRMVRTPDGDGIEVSAGETACARATGAIEKDSVAPPNGAAPEGDQLRPSPAFEGCRRILISEYGAFAPYMLFGSIEGRTAQHDGETVLELTFGVATDDWHGGVWLPARLPQQLADATCAAVAFQFAGGGTLPRDAFVYVRVAGGAKYRTADLAPLFADAAWREVVLRPQDFVPDPDYLAQHPTAKVPPVPALANVDRVELTCVSPPLRAAVGARLGPFRMIIESKEQR